VSAAYSALSHLECPRCGVCCTARVPRGTCSCGSPLLARYDLGAAAGTADPPRIAGRAADLWRYHELLPVAAAQGVVSLGEGMTPLLPMPRLGRSLRVLRLLMKDEGALPTATFKARGAAVGVSRAAELGAAGVWLPSNGNAGAAWAAYAARAGLPCLVVMPAGAPGLTMRECAAAGAELHVVDGFITDAGRAGRALAGQRPGWLEVSTLREPYRLEGKKTIGFEIAEQLGWRVPGVIACPVGGGVGLIGIWKALTELSELGWIGSEMPRLVAVQAAECAPVVRAYADGDGQTRPWVFDDAGPRSPAFGLTVPDPLGGFLVLRALRESGGTAVAVTGAEVTASQRAAARAEGTWVCPEGAACFAAIGRLRASGWLAGDEEVVVLNTGAGLKYPETMPWPQQQPPAPT
jgi:threonine synthase